MKTNKMLIISLVLNICILTGCWDRMSIDKRGFIIAIGIDKYTSEEGKGNQDTNTNRFKVTFAIPNLSKFVGEQGISDEPKFVKVSTGPTMASAYKELEARIDKTVYFGHTKALLLGKELLKDKVLLKESMDILQRNTQFSRSIPVVAVDGPAEEALMTSPDMQPMIGIYITQLFQNNKGESARFEEKKLQNLLENFEEDKMSMIPKLTVGKKDVKIAGGAIVKDYELKGWLSEEETKGILWIRNINPRLEVSVPYKNFYVAYNVYGTNSKIKFDKDGEEIHCIITVEGEGNLEEYILDESAFDSNEINHIEDTIEKKVEEQIQNSIKVLQEKYQADVIEIGKELERQMPKEWDKVKNNWEEVFKGMDFSIKANISIRRVGQSK